MIKNQCVYPQCNSFDPETKEPESILKTRLDIFHKELNFDNWKPQTLLDIGAGKGYFLHHWNTVKSSEAIEYREHIDLPKHCKLHKCKFLEAINLNVAEVVLALRVTHYIYMESLSHNYLIKIAMLCKDKFLFESATDLSKCETSNIKEPYEKAKKQYSERCHDADEKGFFEMVNKFFTLEKEAPCPYKPYRTLYFKRKLPPIKNIKSSNVRKVERIGDVWCKTGMNEISVMHLITICQLLGKTDHLINTLVDENGIVCGLIMKHIENKQSTTEKKQSCRNMFYTLFSFLFPIGYLPVDIVPQNVINDVPIDTGCCHNISLKMHSLEQIDALWRNDVILHHKQANI